MKNGSLQAKKFDSIINYNLFNLEKCETGEVKVSRWFYKIARMFLPEIWSNLDNLDRCKDPDTIHRRKIRLGNTDIEI